jgi:hypothetical protein
LEITQNQSLKSALVKDLFNEIVPDSQIFGNEIWSKISVLSNDAENIKKAHSECANPINDDLRLLYAGDDY